MTERVAIVGTGLIGASVGLGLKQAGGYDIAGFDTDPDSLEGALEVGAIDRGTTSVSEAVAGAALAVVATPVDVAPEVLAQVGPARSDGCVVTDVGSAKDEVVTAGEAAVGARFVGGHPMAGSELRGPRAAHGDLFVDAWWVLTPTHVTDPEAYARVAGLVAALGARPVALEPAAHDHLIAMLSHVPQLTASALVDVVASEGEEMLLSLAAGGFRDVTRIAASHPSMWVSILKQNRKAVLEALSSLGARLSEVHSMIERGAWAEVDAFLAGARTARLELFTKPTVAGPPVGLTMLIADRPGVLAEVTTAAAQLGANIEDLRIVHSTEGGRGRLDLVISGDSAAARLAAELRRLGYSVDRVGPD